MHHQPPLSDPAPLNACVMIDARYLQAKTSGIGRYTEHLIKNLLDLDPTLRLRLITHPERPRPLEHERIVSQQVFAAPPNSVRTCFGLSRAVSFHDAALFHSPFNILPQRLPIPATFTLHDIMWLLNPRYCSDSALGLYISAPFYQHFITRAAHQARHVMTVSEHSREAIEAYFPHLQGRVHVTYNGLDPFFHPRPCEESWSLLSPLLGPKARYVLVVGQGSPYKNHAGALRGFLHAFERDPSIKLVFVRRFTRGKQGDIAELLASPALKGRVIHLPYVSSEQLRALYNEALAFLFPSIYEGFGLPPLEAMACGCPVVTSDLGAPAEVCAPAALCVNPRDLAAISEALSHIHRDASLARQLRERGLQHAATFTWRRTALQAHAAYRAALDGAL